MLQRSIAAYLPEHLRKIVELWEITQTEQAEFDLFFPCTNALLLDQFVETAGEEGLKHLEKIYAIRPKAGSTPGERRFALAARTLEQRPMTELFLRRKLTELCGKDGFTLVVDRAGYQIILRLALASKNNQATVAELIGRSKPANMGVDIDLLYNRHSTFAGRTHGSLAVLTHNTMRSEVL